jgi:hypothetical protein
MPDRPDCKYYNVLQKEIKVTFNAKNNLININAPVPIDLGILI